MADGSFLNLLDELFGPVGGVTRKRMFGGHGLFRDGLMVALVADDTLYLKVDDGNRADFEAEGSAPFSYGTKDGARTITSYWRAPERLYDEPETFGAFAEGAFAAARRGAVKKKAGGTVRPRRARSPSAAP